MFRKGSILLLPLCAVAFVSGCGKKEKPQSAQATQPQTQSASDTQTAPANQPATTPETPSANTAEGIVTARSIDYLRGQIARKNWAEARLALKQLDGRPLTPEQRQYIDGLKAQIPPGK